MALAVQRAIVRHKTQPAETRGIHVPIEIKWGQRANTRGSEDLPTKPRQIARQPPPILFPLYHFKRRFVVDLQAQIFKSDGQMPTGYPLQFFGLEFIEKIAPQEELAIPLPIGIYRLHRAPLAQLRLTQFAPDKLQIPSEIRKTALVPASLHPCCASAIQSIRIQNTAPSPSVRFVVPNRTQLRECQCSLRLFA